MNEAQEYIHAEAFAGFISFCSSNQLMITKFQSDTDVKIPTQRTAIDAMIDESTGRQREIAKSFVEWCADEYGREFLPDDLEVFMRESS